MSSLVLEEYPPMFKMNNPLYAKRVIEEQEDIQKGEQDKKSLSSIIRNKLIQSQYDDVLEVYNVIISFTLFLTFCIGTYTPKQRIYADDPSPEYPLWMKYLEIFLLINILVDYLFFLFIHENRVVYIFSIDQLITYVVIFPTGLYLFDIITDQNIIETYYLKFWKVIRLLSIYRFNKVFTRKNMPIPRMYFKITFSVLMIIFVFGSIMLTLENQAFIKRMRDWKTDCEANDTRSKDWVAAADCGGRGDDADLQGNLLQFIDIFYYMIVTLTTVGYGDIYPHSPQGQIVLILILIVLLSVIPVQFGELSKINNLTSSYSRAFYKKSNKDIRHILLLGDCQPETISTFLKECFHSDHGSNETDVVIMRSAPPGEDINNILKNPKYESKVYYLEGSPMVREDLVRCDAGTARCAIIMSNQYCHNHQAEDYKNILNAFAIKKFVKSMQGPNSKEMQICLQIGKPEHKDLFTSGLQLYKAQKVDQVLCIEELKLQLLAKSSVCPGIITIIWSLITSDTTGQDEKDGEVEDLEPDDDVTELLNIDKTRNAVYELLAQKATGEFGKSKAQKSTTPIDIKSSNDIFNANVQNLRFQKRCPDMEKILADKQLWVHNYQTGTQYELYRIVLKRSIYRGRKFSDIVMILFQKKNIYLIAVEFKITDQMKVFVNPSDYILDDCDHFGYVISSCQPDYDEINGIDFNKSNAENFFIIDYLNKQEQPLNKKEKQKIQQNLTKLLDFEEKTTNKIKFENFYTTSKPKSLKDYRYLNNDKLDKHIEGHIIVCGIVKGIKNLILPLRSRFQNGIKRPIVILSNDNLGDENVNGDTYIWSEINRFEDIYLIRGSALNLEDLERAKVMKAKAVIILSKSYESGSDSASSNSLDADAIFMYKTIESKYKNVVIVTELRTVSAISFLVQGKEESNMQKDQYYSSMPFAAGEIFVSPLLDSLMCQAYYSPKITEILEQLIMGSANTPESIMQQYRSLWLKKCSLNLVEIPKNLNSQQWGEVFENCVKFHGMIPIGVYKRHQEDSSQQDDKNDDFGPGRNDEKNLKKQYVWLHPPKKIELSIFDELFVLSEKNEKETAQESQKNVPDAANLEEKNLKNSGQKIQNENIKSLEKLNENLKELLFSAKEMEENGRRTGELIKSDLMFKIKSQLESTEFN